MSFASRLRGGSRTKTVDVCSDLQASFCVSLPFAVSTSGSIDRSTIIHAVGKALFLSLNKALEQGMVGDDKDFFQNIIGSAEALPILCVRYIR